MATEKKGRRVKCPYCEQYLYKEEAVPYQKRYYHQKCLNRKQKEQQHREELYAYICEKFRLAVPNGFMLKQIKEYKENLNYTYKGMELSLRYFFDTKKNPVTVDSIGIIPFVYEQTKQVHKTRLEAKKHYKTIEGNIVNSKQITIQSPLIKANKQEQKILIDINSL